MTPDELLTAYDDQLRTDAEMARAREVTPHGPLLCGGLRPRRLRQLPRPRRGRGRRRSTSSIERAVAHYRDDTDVESFEWKSRGHDLPADLGDRLVAHGLVAEPVETVMIGEASLLAVDVPLDDTPTAPSSYAGSSPAPTPRADLTRMLDAQESVFGTGRGPSVASSMAELESGGSEFWVAEVGGRRRRAAAASPRSRAPSSPASGAARRCPTYRGRGIYRALVSARAASALERGIRFIHSDCTDMSRPILERSGLRAVTTTTPYVWTR